MNMIIKLSIKITYYNWLLLILEIKYHINQIILKLMNKIIN